MISEPAPADREEPPREVVTEPEQFELNPESAIDLSQDLAEKGYSIWGHGTAHSDLARYFTEGIRTKHTHFVDFALPLQPRPDGKPKGTIADIEMMKHWPHGGVPCVVLFAVPDPDPDNGVPASVMTEHILTENGEDTGLPTQYVYGFYDSTTGLVTKNPHFQISPKDRMQLLLRIQAKIQDIKSTAGPGGLMRDNQLIGESDNISPAPTAQPKDSATPDAAEDVW